MGLWLENVVCPQGFPNPGKSLAFSWVSNPGAPGILLFSRDAPVWRDGDHEDERGWAEQINET
jgi:hypothetical protein